MFKKLNYPKILKGIVLVTFSDLTGPQPLYCSVSDLTEEQKNFISIRAFSGLMAGLDYGTVDGVGKIRGMLDITGTNFKALGIDVITAGREDIDDPRLIRRTPSMIFYVFEEDKWKNVQSASALIEQLTREELQGIKKVTRLTSDALLRHLEKTINYQLLRWLAKNSSNSLYDISTLFKLNEKERFVAQILMKMAPEYKNQGIPLSALQKKLMYDKLEVVEIIEAMADRYLVYIDERSRIHPIEPLM